MPLDKLRHSLKKEIKKEILDKYLEYVVYSSIKEGVYDPGILKAVFLAGGPGSGKSAVSGEILGIPEKVNYSPFGLKVVNSDSAFVHFLKSGGYGTELNKMDSKTFNLVTAPMDVDPNSPRAKAKRIMTKQLELYTKNRLGVLVDGTGDEIKKIRKQKTMLEDMGYDTYMIFVNTDLDVALDRNRKRTRRLPDELVKQSWKEVQRNIGAFQGLFKGNALVVDNSKQQPAGKLTFPKPVYSAVKKFISNPIKNQRGKRWIAAALASKKSSK